MRHLKILAGVAATTLIAAPAFAHPGLAGHADFAGGFVHPFSGWDHMLAMAALGLWLGHANTGKPYAALTTFIGALAAGFVLGLNGFHVPMVEAGILASVLVFGLLTATAAKFPVAVTAPIIAAFTVFHGHAHGAEAPTGAAYLYAAGFIIASVAIVAASYFIARANRDVVVRRAGVVISATGAVLGLVA